MIERLFRPRTSDPPGAELGAVVRLFWRSATVWDEVFMRALSAEPKTIKTRPQQTRPITRAERAATVTRPRPSHSAVNRKIIFEKMKPARVFFRSPGRGQAQKKGDMPEKHIASKSRPRPARGGRINSGCCRAIGTRRARGSARRRRQNASFGRASFTVRARPSRSAPFIFSMASLLSCSVVKVTKAKPRGRPVSRLVGDINVGHGAELAEGRAGARLRRC